MAEKRARILFLTQFEPWNPVYGGAQRAHALFRGLERIAEVDVVYFSPDDRPIAGAYVDEIPVLRRVPARGTAKWCSPILRKLLPGLATFMCRYQRNEELAAWFSEQMRAGTYDLVFGFYLYPVVRLGAFEHSVPVVVDADDFSIDQFLDSKRKAKTPTRLFRYYAAKPLVQYWSKRMLARCDYVFTCKEEDLRFVPHRRAAVLPNVCFGEMQEPRIRSGAELDAPCLLFVGNLLHEPNAIGLQYFFDAIWPGVQAEMPEARVRVVGRATEEQLQGWKNIAGVEFLGFVEDLGAVYAGADVAISPTTAGTGSNCKIVEYIRVGLPVVVTERGLQGFEELRNTNAVLWARSADEFIKHCLQALSDEELRKVLATRAQEVASKHYSQKQFEEILVSKVSGTLGGF